jgi:ADP-sugar diphosphatase
MFGRNVGFICADVEAYLNGKRIPGFTFIRGAAVAMLVLVNGRMILTRQYRVPVGKFTIEAPAGMVDES